MNRVWDSCSLRGLQRDLREDFAGWGVRASNKSWGGVFIFWQDVKTSWWALNLSLDLRENPFLDLPYPVAAEPECWQILKETVRDWRPMLKDPNGFGSFCS